jgi:PAS domain S-box-containing protein
MALRKDGSMLPIELSMGAMNLNGKPATVVYIRDITDRKAAEEALKQSEMQFRAIFENAAMGVGIVDSRGHPLRINTAFEKMVDYTAEELRKTPFKAFMHPDDAFSDAKLFAEMVEGKRNQYAVEKRYIRKDGQIVWGRVTLSAVRDAKGKLSFAVGMVEDITESKMTLKKLQESEEYFRALIENAMDAIVVVRGDGSIGYGSPSIGRMLGYSPEEIVGPDGFRFAHPDDMPKVMDNFAEVMKGPRATVQTELRIQHKNGSWHIVEAVANNLLDNQAIAGIVVNWRDITERKKAEEERVRHTKRVEALHTIAQAASQTLELEELLNLALDKTLEVMEADLGGIYLMDVLEKELVLRASKGLPEDVVERVSSMRLGTRKIQEIQKWAEGSLRLEEVFGENVRGRVSKAIEKAQIKSYAVVPFFIRGQLYGLVAVGTRIRREFSTADIDLLKGMANQIGIGTHNSMLYEEVRALIRETLDAQEKERERVCLDVHDGVAQTLVAAFQYLQSLEVISPDEKDVRGLIAKATVQVKKAIQESREVINSLQPATLREVGLVPTLRHEMKRLEQETGLKVDFKADDIRLPKDIETGLYRIIHEAVFNARKHSNTKRLRVRINSVNGLVKVEVKDWGKGFAQAHLDSSKKRGTGLFSICKRAELMKGACDIQSAPGQGTTVYVEIPFTPAKG